MKLVERRVHIDADVHDVYVLLTDAEQFGRWLAPTATVEPHVGGVITWTHLNGDVVSGTFVELVPDRRIVYTEVGGCPRACSSRYSPGSPSINCLARVRSSPPGRSRT